MTLSPAKIEKKRSILNKSLWFLVPDKFPGDIPEVKKKD